MITVPAVMRHLFLGLAVLVLLATLPPDARAQQQDVVYYDLDFEKTRLLPDAVAEDGRRFRLRRIGGAEGFGAILRDPAAGSQVLELASRATPPSDQRDRAEVQVHSGVNWDRNWYLGFDVMVPRDVTFSQDWQMLAQCHQNNTNRSPPLSLDFEPDGRIALVARADADTYRSLWSAPMPRGRWVRMVLGFRMGEGGWARLWMDGQLMTDQRLALGWRRGDRACSLKLGIYRAATATPFMLRLDDIALGSGLRGVWR